MGTNYYTGSFCPTCGHYSRDKHLGKSSAGWTFTFQWNGGRFYKNYEQMLGWLSGKTIIDEYGSIISIDDFMQMIKDKKSSKHSHAMENKSDNDFMIDGHSFSDVDFN